jgi:hypothetical protein
LIPRISSNGTRLATAPQYPGFSIATLSIPFLLEGASVPLYRVNIHGKNFLIEMDGVIDKWGFYTFRDVMAANPEDAEFAAIQMLREHQRLRGIIKNSVDDPPMMHLEELTEIEVPNPIEPGLTWYPEKTARWWQIWKRGRWSGS